MLAAHADEWNGEHTDQGLTPDLAQSSAYHRGVSFDTFNTRDATDFSLTLNYKHKDYVATRRSRTFLCGTDQNDYSDFALEWLIDELVDDGDEIVCLRAVEKDSKIASDSSVEEGRYRQEAEKLLAQVIDKNKHDEKAISLVMELAIGKVQEIIQRMVRISFQFTSCRTWLIVTLIDPNLRTCCPYRRHSRSQSWGYAGSPPRLRLQILSSAITYTRHRRQTIYKA